MNLKEILTISLGFALLIVVNIASAHGEDIGVVYPDLREPYRSIFTNIIDGIRDTLGNDIQTIDVKQDDVPEKVSEWIKQKNITSIIALGSRSQKLTATLPIRNKIVGAITRPPKDNGFKAGVLLTPDPGQMFSQVNRLLPGIKKIYAIYSQENSGWYIELARSVALEYEIQLIGLESKSKKQSLNQYKTLMGSNIDEQSAIWLLQDPISSDASLILPIVLEVAWEEKIPVISNKAGHVERGALLSLYPDHFELGVSLAQMLLNNKSNEQKYAPFTESLNTANTRTADHLDLEWSRKLKRSFDLVFPKP
jgi:putative ABC transport system substrate-binding protein